MKKLCILIVAYSLSGCAYYLTPRPPLAERKLGVFGSESIGALATSPDYRVVFVKLKKDALMCAEAPADVAGQSASALSTAIRDLKISAELSYEMALTMKQLFQKSQGLALIRDQGFIYCNMYMNGALDAVKYSEKMDELLKVGADLIKLQISTMSNLPFDTTPGPVLSGAAKPAPKASAPLASTTEPPAAALPGIK